MKLNKVLVCVFFCVVQMAFSQMKKEQMIHGKIRATSGNLQGVTVVNLVSEKNADVDSNGEFYILCKVDDLLLFSSTNFEFHRKLIEEEDLYRPIMNIEMLSKSIVLKEVVVNKDANINAVSLRIISKVPVYYSPAQRKLNSGSSGIEGLVNVFSGRKAMLKKNLEVERKQQLLSKMEYLFKDDYYIEKLKITKDFIKGFQYYCVENEDFVKVLRTKSKAEIELFIIEMAENYNQIIASKK